MKKKRLPGVLLGVCLALVAIPGLAAQAAELRVGPNGYESLTAAVAAAAPGDTITLPAAVYAQPDETFPIVIDKPLTLTGEEGAVLSGPPFLALLRVTAPGVTLRNITFQFLRWGVVGLADELTIDQCEFLLADATYRVSSCGIWLAGAYDCAVTDCAFTGCGISLAGPPLSERSKSMPVLTGLFEVGEDPALFTSHTITGNTINGKPLYYLVGEKDYTVPRDAGGLIAAQCENLTIQGLNVSDSSMGLQVIHSKNVRVIDTVADRCGIFGIYLAYLQGGLAQRVSCRETNHGIDMRDVTNMAVLDCVTEHCDQGIFFSWAFDSLTDQCQILDCGNGYFAACGANNQLTRTLIARNENGVHLQGEENLLICENEITGNTVVGIRMLRSGGPCVENSLHDNWVGIILADTAHAALLNNTFTDNASAGLYIRDASGARITQNHFSGNSKAHLEMDGALETTLIRQNVFSGGREKIVNRLNTPIDLTENDWENE